MAVDIQASQLILKSESTTWDAEKLNVELPDRTEFKLTKLGKHASKSYKTVSHKLERTAEE